MTTRKDFKVGDEVYHESRKSKGKVESNDGRDIVIRFEDWPSLTSRFDDDWFRICPTLLRRATPDDLTEVRKWTRKKS